MVCINLSAKMEGLFNQWSDGAQQEGTPSVQTILSFRGLSALSRGEFSEQELSRMELVVLRVLDWNLRSVAHDMIEWIDILFSLTEIEHGVKAITDTMKERTFAQVHDIVCNHRLLKHDPSKLAKAMVMNAAKGYDCNLDIPTDLVGLQLAKSEMNEIQYEMQMESLLRLA